MACLTFITLCTLLATSLCVKPAWQELCSRMQANSTQYVLRKKPPGKVLASAHAVEREFQVLAALKDTPVPVPKALCLCQDAAVIGTPFYVMEHVQASSIASILH